MEFTSKVDVLLEPLEPEAPSSPPAPPRKFTRKIVFDDTTEVIATVMKQRNLKSSQLAELIGDDVTPHHIRDLKRGTTLPSCRTIIMICGLFEVNLDKWRRESLGVEKVIHKGFSRSKNTFDEMIERISREQGFTVVRDPQ